MNVKKDKILAICAEELVLLWQYLTLAEEIWAHVSPMAYISKFRKIQKGQ